MNAHDEHRAPAFRSLGSMPNLGNDAQMMTQPAAAGTPQHYLLRSGMAIAIKPGPEDTDSRLCMVHFGYGTFNVVRLIDELRHPVTGEQVRVDSLHSIVFHASSYTIEGKQSMPTVKEVAKQGMAVAGNTRKVPLNAEDRVEWLWLEATCTPALPPVPLPAQPPPLLRQNAMQHMPQYRDLTLQR